MAVNLIEKLLVEAVQTNGTYVEFKVSDNNIAFICDGGSRKSTRHYRQTTKELKETERSLKNLTEKNVLFSGSLKRISFTLADGRDAVFERTSEGTTVVISARRAIESKLKQYEYVRFLSNDSSDTGVAFAIRTENNGQRRIIPCNGSIMNGVNTTNIQTDLQFVVSGKFYTNNKFFATRYDHENKKSAEAVAEILETAIKDMFQLKLVGMPLFAVLPSTMDEESLLSGLLLSAVKNVCYSYPLFKNRTGLFTNREKMILGTDEVTDLFPQETASPLLGGRYWLEPCEPGSREEYFLVNDMRIPLYDREEFLKMIFQEDHFDELSKIMAEQSDKWLRSFYVFCSKQVEEEITRRQVVSALKNIQSIRSAKGKMFFPSEISIAADISQIGQKAVVVRPSIISPGGKDDDYSERLRDFFTNELNIEPYSQREEIEELTTAMMNKKQAIDKLYANKLLSLAKYDKVHPDEIDFCSYAIFPYESSKGMRRVRAEELVIGKPYIREGALLSSATGRHPLWKGFMKILNKNDLSVVLTFAEKCGAIGRPVIIRQAADRHRDFSDCLFVPGKQGRRDSNFDYTIPGLEEILKRRSLQLNRLVWSALLEANDNEDVLKAEYSVDNRAIVNQCDSSLMIILKERTWVPGKNGKLYMPENIAISDISEEFTFDKKNPILRALMFGSGIKKKEKAIKDMMTLAAREGMRVISEVEYLEFLEWKRKHMTMDENRSE